MTPCTWIIKIDYWLLEPIRGQYCIFVFSYFRIFVFSYFRIFVFSNFMIPVNLIAVPDDRIDQFRALLHCFEALPLAKEKKKGSSKRLVVLVISFR